MNNQIYYKIMDFADRCICYIYDNGFYFWAVTSVFLALISIIYGITKGAASFLFIVAMIIASATIGWMMLFIYLLPFGIIQLICYCIKHPITVIKNAAVWIVSIIILYFIFK